MKFTINLRNPYKEFVEDVRKGRLICGRELFFLLLGFAMVVWGVLFLNGINPLHASGSGWVAIILGAACCAIPGLRIGTRFFARRLVPEDQIHEQLNVDYHALHNVMHEKDVRPRLIVNNTRYFARSDFGSINYLPRASAAPNTGAELLLRAAQEQSQSAPQHLLHTLSDSPAQQTSPANAATLAADETQSIQIGGP